MMAFLIVTIATYGLPLLFLLAVFLFFKAMADSGY